MDLEVLSSKYLDTNSLQELVGIFMIVAAQKNGSCNSFSKKVHFFQ